MSNEETKNTPVIRISITSVVGDGKQQMTMETYADTAAPLEFLNTLTDKLFHVANRQAKLGEIEGMKKTLEQEENQLEGLKADLIRQDEHIASLRKEDSSRVGFKLGPKEKQAREAITVNIKERMRRNAKLKEDINIRIAEWGAPKL